MRDYDYYRFGIMFISACLNKRTTNKIQRKVRRFDTKIEKYIEKQKDIFYKELEQEGFENNMGVIQAITK